MSRTSRALLPHVRVPPAVNQAGFSIAGHTGVQYRNQSWGCDDDTRRTCARHGVTYQAYSPLGGWAMGGTSRVLHDPTVVAVAKAHNRSAAAVALRWVTQQGVLLVTSSNNAAHDADDLASFGFNLTDSEMASLGALR
jgi:diketogulonate reductase-like aldo/keto reductase